MTRRRHFDSPLSRAVPIRQCYQEPRSGSRRIGRLGQFDVSAKSLTESAAQVRLKVVPTAGHLSKAVGGVQKSFHRLNCQTRLTPDQVDAMTQERVKIDSLYRAWIKTISPEDVKQMVVVEAAAAEFESGRARGCRTPHK